MPGTSSKCALVTGASSGIGEKFAWQLAAKGYDLVITARRQDRLSDLAQQLCEKYSVHVEAIKADLTNHTEINLLEKKIESIENLEFLVNNAGFGTFGTFITTDRDRHEDMISVHVVASLRLTHAAIPGMLARGKGNIINVSSIAAFAPFRSVTYSSTKSFLVTFSQALHYNLRGSGIRIQALCPGFTVTEFHETPDYVKSSFQRKSIYKWLWMDTDRVVQASLAALEKDRVICIPGKRYRLIAAIIRNPLIAWIIPPFVPKKY